MQHVGSSEAVHVPSSSYTSRYTKRKLTVFISLKVSRNVLIYVTVDHKLQKRIVNGRADRICVDAKVTSKVLASAADSIWSNGLGGVKVKVGW